MRLRATYVIILLFCVTPLSISIVNARTSYGIWAEPGSYNHQTFRVGKSNLSVKLRIRVSDGGPVSVFIMDERAFEVWDTPVPEEVDAYIGGKNITETRTLSGYLGPQYRRIDNVTLNEMVYYLIVDNRENSDYGSYVNIDFIQTLSAQSAYFSILALIPLVLLISRKRKH